ncbi:hypothetical protein LTR81_027862 [Elasticomyces elasticus]
MSFAVGTAGFDFVDRWVEELDGEVVVCWVGVELDEVVTLVEDEVELVFVLEVLDRVDKEVDLVLLVEDEVELVFMLELLDRVDEEVDVGLLVED